MSKPQTDSITASAIVELLARRHSDDVFVPECKDGPSQGIDHQRMDAWAMRKSWVHPDTFVYEVKVKRSDFLGDMKWPGYLDNCNYFYFACPSGVIRLDECPEQAGLLYVSKTGTKLFTKRKAPFRNVEVPPSLLRYVLMTRYTKPEPHRDRRFWENWVAVRKIDHEFGRRVSKAIRQTMDAEIDEVRRESESLRMEMELYEDLKAHLRAAGIEPKTLRRWNLEDRVTSLKAVVPRRLRAALQSVVSEAARALGIIEEMEARTGKTKAASQDRT